MIRRTLLTFLSLIIVSPLWGAAQFAAGTLPLVDGVHNSTSVVVTNRQPVFSWEYSGAVSSFTVIVSSDDAFSSAGELWHFTGSSTTVLSHSLNFITRVRYNEDSSASPAALDPGRTYHWQVTIFDGATSDTSSDSFSAVAAAVALAAAKYDLAVDWNNPFNPSRGQVTRFRFTAKDRDRRMQLRVFTLSGELVTEWPEQTVLQNAWYTLDWNGKNLAGETVARGVYFVNLFDVGEGKGVTRRVAVVK